MQFFLICYYIIFSVISLRNVPKKQSILRDISRANYGKNYTITNEKKNAFLKSFWAYILIIRVGFEKKIGQISCLSYPPWQFQVKIDPTPNKKIFQKNQMYTRFMGNTTFEIVKMFLGSPQLAFKMYQIPMEHTVCMTHYSTKTNVSEYQIDVSV